MEAGQDITVEELLQTAEAVSTLVKDPAAFREAHTAFNEDNAEAFQGALEKVGLTAVSPIICGFFCTKCCIAVGRRFCSGPKKNKSDAEAMFACAQAFESVFRDAGVASRFITIVEQGDIQAWNLEISRYNLQSFCYEICVLVCSRRCKKKCGRLCEPSG